MGKFKLRKAGYEMSQLKPGIYKKITHLDLSDLFGIWAAGPQKMKEQRLKLQQITFGCPMWEYIHLGACVY